MPMILDTITPWLSNPLIAPVLAAIFAIRALIVIIRLISVLNVRISLIPRKIADIQMLERTNVSLRDKDTALYCRMKLVSASGGPVANKKADLYFYKGSHRLSGSSFRGQTRCVSDKNGICEFSGIRVYEQGVVDAVFSAGGATAYLNGIDLTDLIVRRNSIPNPNDELFEKKPDRRLGFYNSKLDNILNKSTEIGTDKESRGPKVSSFVIQNIITLILIAVFPIALTKLPVIAALVVCLLDIIIFLVLISSAKSLYGAIKESAKNADKAREDLHKDIIYLYNEILYDLRIIVSDSENVIKKPVDLQEKCIELAMLAGFSEAPVIT